MKNGEEEEEEDEDGGGGGGGGEKRGVQGGVSVRLPSTTIEINHSTTPDTVVGGRSGR